ncbi:MAG: GxxExxY protein [Pyrinomonadaceae bacterium]|nr:GxxExxY protein [Pyrinomonadaceae bacterium]MBP6212888.1 GxxExxY protein [Pyrinomonadaceae bacterium]
MGEIIYKDEGFQIIGACFEVYNHKGFGFTEPVYQECLQHEFTLQGIPFVAQPELPMTYKGIQLAQKFKPDFICFEKIVVEIKSVAGLTDAHRAQTINYLHATAFELGLLVNFGQFPKLIHERLAYNKRNHSATTYEIIGNREQASE